jgi:cell division protein FtsB
VTLETDLQKFATDTRYYFDKLDKTLSVMGSKIQEFASISRFEFDRVHKKIDDLAKRVNELEREIEEDSDD